MFLFPLSHDTEMVICVTSGAAGRQAIAGGMGWWASRLQEEMQPPRPPPRQHSCRCDRAVQGAKESAEASWGLGEAVVFVFQGCGALFPLEHFWFCLGFLEAVRRNSWMSEGKCPRCLMSS